MIAKLLFLTVWVSWIFPGCSADVINFNVKLLDIEDDHNDDNLHYPGSENIYGPNPHGINKRSAEKYEDDVCVRDGSFTDERHSQNAIIVKLDSTTELPCHYCGEPVKKSHKRMLWYKFKKHLDKATEKLFWQAQEVKLDTHDRDVFNRIFTKLDHTLVIRNFETDDVGTYICEPPTSETNEKYAFTSEHINSNSAVSMAIAWEQLQDSNGISYLHHVDVQLPMQSKVVSEEDADFPKPNPALSNEKGNWMAYTKWELWGECNVCGSAGERRREGQCTVKILDPTKGIHPKHLDQMLRFYADGAPCHSTLFTNFADIVKRRNEIEVGSCASVCKDTDNSARDVFGVPNFDVEINSKKQRPLDKTKPPAPEKTLQVNIGERLDLECPDTGQLTAVAWYNGSHILMAERIASVTQGRVHINISQSNALNYTAIILHDENTTLTCRVGDDIKATYHLTINPNSIKEDISPYLKILGYSYIVNFVIVVVGTMFQYRKSSKQVTRRRKR